MLPRRPPPSTHRRRRPVESTWQHSVRTFWRRSAAPVSAQIREYLEGLFDVWSWPFLLGTGWYASKWGSAMLAAAAVGLLAWFAVDSRFEVSRTSLSVDVRSPYASSILDAHLTPADAGEFDQVVGRSIFTLQPRALRQAALGNPFVTKAEVRLQLPDEVKAVVDEAMPTLAWVTQHGTYVVNAAGIPRRIASQVVSVPDEPTGFLTLFDWQGHAQLARPYAVDSRQSRLDPDLVATILAIRGSLLAAPDQPDALQTFHFTQAHGLNFVLPGRATRVVWGDSLHMERKLANLQGIWHWLEARELNAELIDVRPLSKPYYR